MSPLRLISANLFGDRCHPEGLAELLERHAPDVAALQELTHQTSRVVRSLLPHGSLRPIPDGDGVGLALRHPAPVEEVPLPYRSALSARLSVEAWSGLSGSLEVVSVHLLGPPAWPPWRAWPIRLGQLRGLEAHLDRRPDVPLVLAGDLNATPLWPAYRRLTARLTDQAQRLARADGRRAERTWSPRPGWPRLLRIDHLLTAGVEAARVEVVTIPGSDHAALVAELR